MATKYAGQNSLNKLMSLIKNAMPKASTATPLMDGTAAVGTSNAFARGDHVHPSDTAKVSKSGDTMTGALTVKNYVTGTRFRIPAGTGQLDLMAVQGADSTYFNIGETSGVDVVPVIISGVKTPTSDEHAANKKYVDGKVSGLQTAADVQSAIAAAISGVYTPKGTIAFASLPVASAENRGWVYNISDAFTTTASFVEGAGHSYGAGTNVVCVDAGSGTYQWDVLAGAIDMTELTADEVQSIWDSI